MLMFVHICMYCCSQRKQQRDLLAALQKVVVPIYCTSFFAVEEDKQQKITRVHLDDTLLTVTGFVFVFCMVTKHLAL